MYVVQLHTAPKSTKYDDFTLTIFGRKFEVYDKG